VKCRRGTGACASTNRLCSDRLIRDKGVPPHGLDCALEKPPSALSSGHARGLAAMMV